MELLMSDSRKSVKLIALGYHTAGTGLTRVMRSIMRRLAGRHEIHFLGIGYSGEIIRDHGLTIYPTNRKGGDIFAAFQAKKLIEEINPTLVFIMHDLWIFDYYLSAEGVAKALDNLYYNPEHRQKLAQAAFAASQELRYSWNTIIEQFNNLFVGLSQ